MNARVLPATGRAAVENELLAQLGLPPSASPEDIDDLHAAASDYLAAAPASLRGWAHAQARTLDAAYLKLTDPVGLEGSALRSPTRPPTVVPGGPATPPARRDSVPATTIAAAAAIDEDGEPVDDLTSEDEIAADDEAVDPDALYAMVTPSAHEDMAPDRAHRARGVSARSTTAARPAGRPSARVRGAGRVQPSPQAAQQAASIATWKRVVLGAGGLIVVAALAVGLNAFVNGSAGNAGSTDQAAATAPAIDAAKVADLMSQYQADPNNVDTLLALADEFYAGQQYSTAGQWLDKALALDPNNVQALLARGAVSYDLGDYTAAEVTWKKVVVLAPDNQEVHYDLGFLYLSLASPNWDGVQSEWAKVIAIDSTTTLAQRVQQHLDQLAAASMLPAGTALPTGAASGAPGASPAASPAATAATPAPSAAASPPASAQP